MSGMLFFIFARCELLRRLHKIALRATGWKAQLYWVHMDTCLSASQYNQLRDSDGNGKMFIFNHNILQLFPSFP